MSNAAHILKLLKKRQINCINKYNYSNKKNKKIIEQNDSSMLKKSNSEKSH